MAVQETQPRSFLPGRLLAAGMVVAGAIGLAVALGRPTAPTPEYQQVPLLDMEATGPFDYGPWASVLRKCVNAAGMVDYAAVKADPAHLNQFVQQVAEYSPDRNLAMFVSEADALAYWANAYNALMMKAVIDAYPTDSVMAIGDQEGAVFDEKTRNCGGALLSLNEIEHDIVRARFHDPRVHFALNCASLGCPPLPREPFLPGQLDEQLSRATKDFLGRKWYCRVADGGATVQVSSILDWYGEDFLAWLEKSGQAADIGRYIALYAPARVADAIANAAAIEYIEYDWRLNDQGASWGDVQRR